MAGETSYWSQFWSDWETGWGYLWREAQDTYLKAVEKDPERYRQQAQDFAAALEQTRRDLDRIKAGLPNPATTPEAQAQMARYQDLEKRYQELAAPFYAQTQPIKAAPSTGFLPVLVLGGMALSAAAVAWAIPSYQYAVNLREQTALAASELDARVLASQQGRTLQASTLPVQETPSLLPGVGMGSAGKWLLGGLVLAAGVLVVPQLLPAVRRRG